MHSAVLGSSFLPKSQELRLVEFLEFSPRFAPWGIQGWENPDGFTFQTIDQVPVPEAVLVRNRDHAAVLLIDRYSNLVHSDSEHVVFTSVRDMVPTLHVIRLHSLDNGLPLRSYRQHKNSAYFPFVNRDELRLQVPRLPRHISGFYELRGENKYFVWTLDSQTGLRSHEPITWFNEADANPQSESIEMILRDRVTGVLVGSGAGIPPFVLTPDGSKLLGLLRTYDPGTGQITNLPLIEKWRERLRKESSRALLI